MIDQNRSKKWYAIGPQAILKVYPKYTDKSEIRDVHDLTRYYKIAESKLYDGFLSVGIFDNSTKVCNFRNICYSLKDYNIILQLI